MPWTDTKSVFLPTVKLDQVRESLCFIPERRHVDVDMLGKTFTMEGPEGDRGVNYRAIEELFRLRDERKEAGQAQTVIKVSMLEVYNGRW